MLDLDVQKFFDSVDHDRMVRAVEANTTHEQRWVVLYVKRWLKAPLALPDGTIQARECGCPFTGYRELGSADGGQWR